MKVVCKYGLLQMSELLKHQAELNSQLQDWSQDIQQEPLACHQLCEVVLRRLRALELMVHRNTQALSDLRSHVSQWCPAWASSLSLQHQSSRYIEIHNLSPSTLACVTSCVRLFCIVYIMYITLMAYRNMQALSDQQSYVSFFLYDGPILQDPLA